MRIKIIKGIRKGRVMTVSKEEADELIKIGKAIVSKDMVESDYKVRSKPDDLDKQAGHGFAT